MVTIVIRLHILQAARCYCLDQVRISECCLPNTKHSPPSLLSTRHNSIEAAALY